MQKNEEGHPEQTVSSLLEHSVEGYCPPAQNEQVDGAAAAAGQKLFSAHGMELLTPTEQLYPIGHGSEEYTLGQKEPAGHGKQPADCDTYTLPTLHDPVVEQLLASLTTEYVPAVQFEHTVSVVAMHRVTTNWPGTHVRHGRAAVMPLDGQ